MEIHEKHDETSYFVHWIFNNPWIILPLLTVRPFSPGECDDLCVNGGIGHEMSSGIEDSEDSTVSKIEKP
jgi:hypothetical protein